MDQRLKRRLLSEAVEDNVRAIKNQPRGRLARGRPVPWAILAAVAALAVFGPNGVLQNALSGGVNKIANSLNSLPQAS